ncbi:phosphopentomutase/phosphoglucosamine mutase [Halorussus gelatinilyticus]|uniref:Phosphopentomutase/phosphoglucosamine mutase n=1 Tax=Halorussus gelatinilyticus TaxID=2937524 RepID=A0A8U0IFX7_9EURY|nr:phosphopentomutase/phosphoglucosamine mutase [Halorussus gelatinilyticus]UPV99575.1 phosphopentomutase/phosphoglucosamine mutase [Halorussus gelatinilyticus]
MSLFGTAGIRGSAVETVTPELALAVGRAAGRDGAEFVVARDGRETGTALAAAMEAGLESAGADVRRAGQLPTPALAFASQGRRGAMLTASHNPPTDNGIKLFADGEEYDRDAERTVDSRVEADDPPVAWDRWGDSERVSVLDDYRDAVVAYAQQQGAPLDGLRVVVDCGNGMAAVATPQVLRALGAEVVTLNANVDGHFPGRDSKPTPETLEDLREFLRADPEADLGIGHDGDADRIVIVDADGDVVHEDTVVAVLAAHYTDRSDAGDPVVVTTPNASGRIDERVEESGGRVERVRLGALHEGIAAARADGDDDTEVVFAAEPWKHVHTQFGGWIDGVTSAAVISRLVADAGGLAPLREPVTERPYRKVSVSCPDDAKAAVMERLETTIPETFPDAEVATEYGVRATLPDASWVLVRPSGTEPYVRIYAESDDVDALVATASDAVEEAVDAES